MVLVDLTGSGVTGRKTEEALDEAGIIVNRNAIPFDPQPPWIASGIRLGTPAITTRGFGKEEVKQIASLIVRVLTSIDDKELRCQVSREVGEMCRRFPLPGVDAL